MAKFGFNIPVSASARKQPFYKMVKNPGVQYAKVAGNKAVKARPIIGK